MNIAERDWYVYDENYATSKEKEFVKYISKKIELLRNEYPESGIYLLRNELDYWLFSSQDGRRFSPGYLLFISDCKNKRFYYQRIVEVKGGHLIDKDQWKEDALVSLNKGTEIAFKFDEDD